MTDQPEEERFQRWLDAIDKAGALGARIKEGHRDFCIALDGHYGCNCGLDDAIAKLTAKLAGLKHDNP